MKHDVAFGLDLGGSWIKYGLVRRAGEVLANGAVPTDAGRRMPGVRNALRDAVKLAKDLAVAHDVKPRILGCGCAGTLVGKGGRLVTPSPSLPFMKDFEIAAFMESINSAADGSVLGRSRSEGITMTKSSATKAAAPTAAAKRPTTPRIPPRWCAPCRRTRWCSTTWSSPATARSRPRRRPTPAAATWSFRQADPHRPHSTGLGSQPPSGPEATVHAAGGTASSQPVRPRWITSTRTVSR